MLNRPGVAMMQGLAWLPLAWLRGLGWLLGLFLYIVAAPRRRVARINLGLCFPGLTPAELRVLTRRSFVRFAQAWMDRAWLWHGAPAVVRQRLHLTGDLEPFDGAAPLVIFAPHFVGLDAGWTALTQQLPRRFTTIYTRSAQSGLDAWIQAGRQRFGGARLFARIDAAKPVLAALRAGEPLYLLPDMNFDVIDSVFVPFFGVPAATLPSLSRFARLGRAKVVTVVVSMTASGYQVNVLPAWKNFPTDDVVADTALMNRKLEGYIRSQPAQYFWVHKRFKTRPDGMQELY